MDFRPEDREVHEIRERVLDKATAREKLKWKTSSQRDDESHGKNSSRADRDKKSATRGSRIQLPKKSRDTVNFARLLVCLKKSTGITLPNAVTRKTSTRRGSSLVDSIAAQVAFVITSVRLASRRSAQQSTRIIIIIIIIK